jgi:hypothetical protein
VLNRIFRPMREKFRETGEDCVRSFITCTFHQILSGRMRWAGHVARMGAIKNVYNILAGKHEGKRPFIRRRSR